MKIKLAPGATAPTRATTGSAGYDLYAYTTTVIDPGEWESVSVGIAIAIPEGKAGFIYPRSGYATKQGMNLINCVGVIDSDYRGEIKVPLHNNSRRAVIVENGQRIAQLVITTVETPDLEVVEELDETERGGGGFGSTGR